MLKVVMVMVVPYSNPLESTCIRFCLERDKNSAQRKEFYRFIKYCIRALDGNPWDGIQLKS